MYRKMLIAVDGTETSRHALDQALVLARSEESEVTLASVVPSYDGDLRILGDKSALAAMRRPHEEAVAQAVAQAEAQGVRTRSVLAEGDPVEEILALAEKMGADCVALGKRGSYYSDLIPIGSVAAKIARLSGVDVLLVPNHKPLRLDRIVAPLDGSAPSREAGARAVDLAVRYGSFLLLATVYELPLEGFVRNPDLDKAFYDKASGFQRPILDLAERKGVQRVQAVVRQGVPVYRVLTDLIRQEDAGLVVMGTAGRSDFHRLLLGSVAERVVGSGAAPVLLVKKETA